MIDTPTPDQSCTESDSKRMTVLLATFICDYLCTVGGSETSLLMPTISTVFGWIAAEYRKYLISGMSWFLNCP